MASRPPHPPEIMHRETAASYVSRLASLIQIDAATFAADKGTTFQKVINGETEAFDEMRILGTNIPGAILDWSPIKAGPGRRRFRGHSFSSKVVLDSELRGCAICLRSDADGSANLAYTRMAMRGHWLVPHITLCLEHEHPLVPLWQETNPTSRFDSALHLANLSDDIVNGRLDRHLREPTDFDIWIEGRLHGEPGSGWLSSHDLHAASTFCFLLGNSMLRLDSIEPRWALGENRWAPYQLGFAVAEHGIDAIRDALKKLQLLPVASHDGAKKIFPLMYDRLSHDYRDDPNFEPYRQVLRDHMSQTWPLGPGDELLGEPVIERRLHSVRTAALATGIDQRRMRKMLEAAGVVPKASVGLPDSWEVFDARAMQALLVDLAEFMAAKDFAEFIGASRSQFNLLVRDGVLGPSLLADNVKAVWSPSTGVAFLASILSGATTLTRAHEKWVHLSISAQRLKIGPGAIIEAIREGRINLVGKHPDKSGYASIYVYHDEVGTALGTKAPKAMSIELFAKSVGLLPPSRMKRLIDHGYMPATTMKNPITKANQRYIAAPDAEAFHCAFMTPRSMALQFTRSWQSIGAELRAKGVMPFSPNGEDYGSLFLRSEVLAKIP